MVRSHIAVGRSVSAPTGLAIGVCLSLVLTVLMSVVMAKLISTEKLEWEKIGYAIIATLFIASLIGSKTACTIVKRRKLMICMTEGLLYWLTLLLMTALFFGGQYSGLGVSGIVIISASAVVSVLELKAERGGRKTLNRSKIGKRSR